MECQNRLKWIRDHKRSYLAKEGMLHNKPRRAYGADVPLLLSPFVPGKTELHVLLLQWVPVGQTLRPPLTVWEHKKLLQPPTAQMEDGSFRKGHGTTPNWGCERTRNSKLPFFFFVDDKKTCQSHNCGLQAKIHRHYQRSKNYVCY